MNTSSDIQAKPGPRTPVRRNGIATRTRIVEAAIAMIAEDGATLSMRPLAERAGCSPAAIYQFFADLDHVGAAVVEQVTSEALTELRRHVSPALAATDPTAFFSALIEGVEALQAARPETLCLARPQPAGPRAALAGALRTVVRDLVAAAFAEAWPAVAPGRREEVLDVAQAALLGALGQVPPRGSARRAAYLADVAALAGGFAAQALARPR